MTGGRSGPVLPEGTCRTSARAASSAGLTPTTIVPPCGSIAPRGAQAPARDAPRQPATATSPLTRSSPRPTTRYARRVDLSTVLRSRNVDARRNTCRGRGDRSSDAGHLTTRSGSRTIDGPASKGRATTRVGRIAQPTERPAKDRPSTAAVLATVRDFVDAERACSGSTGSGHGAATHDRRAKKEPCPLGETRWTRIGVVGGPQWIDEITRAAPAWRRVVVTAMRPGRRRRSGTRPGRGRRARDRSGRVPSRHRRAALCRPGRHRRPRRARGIDDTDLRARPAGEGPRGRSERSTSSAALWRWCSPHRSFCWRWPQSAWSRADRPCSGRSVRGSTGVRSRCSSCAR